MSGTYAQKWPPITWTGLSLETFEPVRSAATVIDAISMTSPALSVTVCGTPAVNAGAPPPAGVLVAALIVTWVLSSRAVTASMVGNTSPVSGYDATTCSVRHALVGNRSDASLVYEFVGAPGLVYCSGLNW